MARLAAWAGLLAAALYVLVLGGAWNGIYTPELRASTMLVSSAILGSWAVLSWRRPAWRPATTLWPAIAAVLGSLALSTLFSRNQRVSLEYLAYAVVLVALYLLLVRLFADPFFRARLAALAGMLFVGLTVLYLAENLVLWAGWWSIVGRITVPPLRPYFAALTYGNPSAALTMVALLAMPALATFGASTRWRPLVVALVVLAVAVVALISGSRAGWFAIGVTLMLTVGAWLGSPARRAPLIRAARELLSSPRGRLLGLAAIAVVIGGAIVIGPPILIRVTAGGEASRLAFSVVALRIFAAAPVLGTGPGTWTIQHIAFTQPGESTEYIPYAHNLETQTLSELGMVGALAGVIVVANVAWLVRSALRDADPARRRWAAVAVIGLTYFVLHQLLDFYENLPAAMIAAAWPVAYLDATAATGPTIAGRRLASTSGQRRFLALTGLVTVFAASAWVVSFELPARQALRAVTLSNDGNWASADAPARAAAATDPSMSPYVFTAGLTAAHAGDAASAAGYFERVAMSDDYPEAWLDLAAERHALGDDAAAVDALQNALRVGIQQPSVAFAAGSLALDLGQRDVATTAFRAALSALPSLSVDPWWQQDDVRAALLAEVTRNLLATAGPDVRWQLELVRGDAAVNADASSTSDPGLASAVTQAWQGDAAARSRLEGACTASPLDTDLLFWCARVAAHLGDERSQEHWIEVAAGTPSSDIAAGSEVVVATTPLVGRYLAGSPGYFWGLYTYRRPTPWDILVPSLPHVTIDQELRATTPATGAGPQGVE